MEKALIIIFWAKNKLHGDKEYLEFLCVELYFIFLINIQPDNFLLHKGLSFQRLFVVTLGGFRSLDVSFRHLFGCHIEQN